ncbi:YccV-like-domain-containing protein [Delitschia confertaspora ATCC 74209]|uniref:YccV-like-domain-containing protein n=1 Tax=Delitschia confertaspora ATCC 74209 TaxID=1513339 RepID=A0A9P4JH32_9PLEO|nr:YccV-like-domain-containing protein [Delitschia confertaspora ATCC 74209]
MPPEGVMAGFTDVPTEILQIIFEYLSPRSLNAISRTSKAFHTVANSPIIWRHLCQTQFAYWAPHHDIVAKFCGPLSAVDWCGLFIQRIMDEQRTRELLNNVLGSQKNRINHINEIADLGYDAKEVLLKEYNCPDDAEDVLARRYYAQAILEHIQRELAIKVWEDLGEGKDVPIEVALGAYDLFTQAEPGVDIDSVTSGLDSLAKGVLKEYADFPNWSPRKKASTLVTFLRDHGFQGVSDSAYRALQNSFIGLVLSSEGHESLPLISVAIYCALAQRLSLDARPCGFVYHVYSIVYAPQNTSLDGENDPNIRDQEFMYLDPFRSPNEVPKTELQNKLRELGIPTSQYEEFLSDTGTREMVVRTARNIMNSVQTIRQTNPGTHGIGSWVDTSPDMDSAFYAALWATAMLTSRQEGSSEAAIRARRRQFLPFLLDQLQEHYPWDAVLLERHIIPLFASNPDEERLRLFVNSVRDLDAMPKRIQRRDETATKVRFKVGQLFKHRRYHYEGVITGWDPSCIMGEDWIRSMDVDGLPRGRHQSFYHVLVCDKSIRYVAEENISPSTEPPSSAMLKLAGRHFKRWDPVAGVFISNVKDEYPED